MPTNEERREVAARLRGYEEDELCCYGEAYDALCEACGCDWGQDWQDMDLNYRLADLIEPEPERTCRMTQYGPEYVLEGWWHCSECEGPVYPPCNEEIAVWALQRCPRCGAKVVE